MRLDVIYGHGALRSACCAQRFMHGADIASDRIAPDQEELLNPAVGSVVEQRACGGLAVASCAAALLVVRFERSRELVMQNEADVRFVDAHAESTGRDHYAHISAHESILIMHTLGRAETAVIARDRFPGLR